MSDISNELVLKAIEIAKENKNNFSKSLLQRKLRIGCIKCNKIIEVLEDKKIVEPYDDKNKIRKVLI